MGLNEEDFRNSISVDIVDKELIRSGCRVTGFNSIDTNCDAVLTFDASYLIKKVKILASDEVTGVSKNQSELF